MICPGQPASSIQLDPYTTCPSQTASQSPTILALASWSPIQLAPACQPARAPSYLPSRPARAPGPLSQAARQGPTQLALAGQLAPCTACPNWPISFPLMDGHFPIALAIAHQPETKINCSGSPGRDRDHQLTPVSTNSIINS